VSRTLDLLNAIPVVPSSDRPRLCATVRESSGFR
jgi:hypothetical protein